MKVAKKTVVKKETGFSKPMKLSEALEDVVGKGPLSRGEVTKKLWVYIKEKGLQDKTDKRVINPDKKLAVLFDTKKGVNMFKMTKLIGEHLTAA